MMITLYKCTDDNAVANKTLLSPTVKTVNAYNAESILSPHFVLAYDADILTYNYISAFGRYYRIVDYVLNNNNSITLHTAIDVILSYWNNIKNCDATVIRTGARPTDIPDTKLPIYPNDKIFEGIRINNSIGNPCYVIQLRGADT